jgi:hypothetical protein
MKPVGLRERYTDTIWVLEARAGGIGVDGNVCMVLVAWYGSRNVVFVLGTGVGELEL